MALMISEASRKAAAALPLEVRRLLVNLWTGKTDGKSLVDWATDQLVAGKDSPALRILAGLSGADSREVQEYFQKAVAELRIEFPNKHDCLVCCCGDIAREVIANRTPALHAYASLWQITSELNYPSELRCWAQLEMDLAMMEDRGASVTEQETAVRQVCQHFLTLLDSFTESGVPRLSFDRSLAALRSRGFEVPSSVEAIPRSMPNVINEGLGERLSFFRTRAEREDFRDLTIPWSLFLRSDIVDCRFENTDLSESSMTWCDWTNCIFMYANLRGCDLRRSIFRNCAFYNAILDEADLRGARFDDCRFGYASMNRTRLEKVLGFFTGPRKWELRLSKEQAKHVCWVSGAGEVPDGG